MCDQCEAIEYRPGAAARTKPFVCEAISGKAADMSPSPSRRGFLAAGAGLLASAPLPLSHVAFAQGAASPAAADIARLRSASRILIKGGVILSMDAGTGDFAKGDVLIEGGKIRDIRPVIEASGGDVMTIDATNQIIMPGFIDTHHHFYQGLLRNILANGLLAPDYMRDISGKLTSAYSPDDVYAGTLVSALGMLDMGTTSAVDTSQVNHSPEHADAGIRALQDSGMRVTYAFSRGDGPKANYPGDIGRLQKTYFNSSDQLLTLALAGGLVAAQFEAGRAAGVPMVSHGVNNRTEKALATLAQAKLLRPGDEYIHCTQLSADSWRLIKDSGGVVSLSAPIEMMMGHGMPGIQDALDHGIRPSLSSDVDVTFAQDPFTVMRSTISLQRLLLLQRADKGEKNLPPLMTVREVLEYATIEGARCMGLESRTGSLTPGKDADLVMLDAGRLNVWPLNNAPGCVVNLMNPANVKAVFVAGKVKKWNGELAGVDEVRIRKLVEEGRDGVVKRAGFEGKLF